jgi:hypothetical protein
MNVITMEMTSTYIKHILYFFAILATNCTYGQRDSLTWSKETSFAIANQQHRSEANFLSLQNSIQISDDSTFFITVYVNENESWFSPELDDELEQDIFYLLFSKAELWSRKQSDWLWYNTSLPIDYKNAQLEDTWEKTLEDIEKTKAEILNNPNKERIDSLIINILQEIDNYTIYSNKSRMDYGYGMTFYTSTGQFANNKFSNPYGMGIELQFYYKKTGISFKGDLLHGIIKENPFISNIWEKNQRIQHGQFTISISQKIIDRKYMCISPYVGYGYYESVPLDSLSHNNLVMRESERIKTTQPEAGLYIDYKLGQKKTSLITSTENSYWMIRMGIKYIPLNYEENFSSSYWGVSIGIGGFSKFVPYE